MEGAAAAAVAGLIADEAAAYTSTRLTVQVRGTGADVVLIPGLTNGRSVWEGLLKAVPGNRYHLVQVAGFAGDPARGNAQGPVVASVAAEIARYVAETALKRPAVIGHSMGGIVAMMIGARYPARAGKIMAIDILPSPATGFGFDVKGMQPFVDSIYGLLTASPDGRRTLEQLIKTYGAGGRDSDAQVVARATHELATLDLKPELAKIRDSLTVLYAVPTSGEAANAIRRRYASAYEAVPHVNLRPVANSGHMIMFDQPHRFAEEVRRFLS